VITTRIAKSRVAVHVSAVDIRGSREICRGSEWRVGVPQRPFSDGSRCRRALPERLSDAHLHHHILEWRMREHRGWQQQELERLVDELTRTRDDAAKKCPRKLRYKEYRGLTQVTVSILNGLGR
jgi:hypothetical protein